MQCNQSVEVFIPTNRGIKSTLVSCEDVALALGSKWYVHSDGYLCRSLNYVKTQMHRLILKNPDTKKFNIDHINHNKLDNRRSNLQVLTHSENRKKRIFREDRGVYYRASRNKWAVIVVAKRKLYHFGLFESKEDALKVSKEKHKEFAILNKF